VTTAAGSAATRILGKWLIVGPAGALLCLAVYNAFFFLVRFAQPAILNSNEGPGGLYQGFFYPLRALTAHQHHFMRHWWQGSGQRTAQVTIGSGGGTWVFITEEGGPTYRIADDAELPMWNDRKGIATITWRSELVCDDAFADWWRASVTGVTWQTK
jgi:hypothetical protein